MQSKEYRTAYWALKEVVSIPQAVSTIAIHEPILILCRKYYSRVSIPQAVSTIAIHKKPYLCFSRYGVSIPQAVSTIAIEDFAPEGVLSRKVSIPQAVSTIAIELFLSFLEVDETSVSIPQAVSTIAMKNADADAEARKAFQYRKR